MIVIQLRRFPWLHGMALDVKAARGERRRRTLAGRSSNNNGDWIDTLGPIVTTAGTICTIRGVYID